MAGHTVYLEVIRNARHRQLVKRRVIIVSGVVVLVALGWAYMAGLIVPRYPRKWVGVHTGMTREQIHTSIGPPTTDSFEAKGLDRWKTKALLGERTLDVLYRSSKGEDRAIWVAEGSFSRVTYRMTSVRNEQRFEE